MRSRLLVIVLFLVGMLAAGLGVPLALSNASEAQLALFNDRVSDAIYFASLAERPLVEGATAGLQNDMRTYDELYGVTVTVLDPQGQVVAASRAAVPTLDADGVDRVKLAMVKRPPKFPPMLWPWDPQPMVVAVPVLVDAEMRGVVVTVSPTDGLHSAEIRDWSAIAAVGLLALGLAVVVVALPIVRWILRPVRRLDEGTGRVAAAVLAGAEPEPVSDGSGPPELRRLTASFDRMAETVTQAYTAQRAFVADASHQLRNPLTALALRLSNLDGQVKPSAVEDHHAALEEAERLSTLLDGLLALARAERTAPLTSVDVDAGVADRLEAWRPLAEHTGIELVREGERGLRAIATAGAVETVLDAVLDNAVKFTPSGGSITVRTTKTDAHVEIAMRDTGPGIAPEEMDRATDRFWRSPGQANVEGSGLGLAIAARTVELAGGSLRLSTPPGGGLCVTASLPLVVPEFLKADPG